MNKEIKNRGDNSVDNGERAANSVKKGKRETIRNYSFVCFQPIRLQIVPIRSGKHGCSPRP